MEDIDKRLSEPCPELRHLNSTSAILFDPIALKNLINCKKNIFQIVKTRNNINGGYDVRQISSKKPVLSFTVKHL